MSTKANFRRMGVVLNKETSPQQKKHADLFYSEGTWKFSPVRELSEKAIDTLILGINEFYDRYLAKNRKELVSFGFQLDFNKESSEFELIVSLSAEDYISTDTFAPPSIDLPVDESSPLHKKKESLVSTLTDGDNGLKVELMADDISSPGDDSGDDSGGNSIAPTQNTGDPKKGGPGE